MIFLELWVCRREFKGFGWCCAWIPNWGHQFCAKLLACRYDHVILLVSFNVTYKHRIWSTVWLNSYVSVFKSHMYGNYRASTSFLYKLFVLFHVSGPARQPSCTHHPFRLEVITRLLQCVRFNVESISRLSPGGTTMIITTGATFDLVIRIKATLSNLLLSSCPWKSCTSPSRRQRKSVMSTCISLYLL